MADPKSSSRKLKLAVPREGLYWLVIGGILWLAGGIKGINLIILLAASMLAFWLLNALGARRRLSHLQTRRWIQEPIFAGLPAAIEIELANTHRKPLLGVRVEDRGPEHSLARFVPRVDGNGVFRFREQVCLPRRGKYPWEPLAITGTPFGLVRSQLVEGNGDEALVYPALGKLNRSLFQRFSGPGRSSSWTGLAKSPLSPSGGATRIARRPRVSQRRQPAVDPLAHVGPARRVNGSRIRENHDG